MTVLSSGLAGRSVAGRMGYDALDQWTALRKVVAAAGLSKRWGICETCKGSGIDPVVSKAYREWRSWEPFKGDGWQLWETTSEGSPVSPVFATSEELAAWCESNATLSGDTHTSKEQWSKMFATSDGCDIGSTPVVFREH
jgi:hypothetical protein